MRTVHVSCLRRDVSVIGFGCASLGSRVSASAGRRAVFEALDRGVTWFDVAPPYGDGRAENLLGDFLAGRRHEVVICTKFGIARPEIDPVRRMVRPMARQAVALFPSLRDRISKARRPGMRSAIRPEAIEASVTESLHRLRTDYVDVLAMHEPSADEAADEAIHSAITALVRKGYARAVSIAGTPASGLAAVRAGRRIDLLQFPDGPFEDSAACLRAAIPGNLPVFVTHGVFGSATLARIRSLPSEKLSLLADLARTSGLNGGDMAANLSALFAFSSNPAGVVVASMLSKAHIERNCLMSSISPAEAAKDRLIQILHLV
jgi:aryl-alcohol dehydrogenase-like predicted oxidoreductase